MEREGKWVKPECHGATGPLASATVLPGEGNEDGVRRESTGAIDLGQRPLVLASHLVPSLPVGLFETLAEIVEAATGRAVVLLHEARVERPVASDIVDIAILPAAGEIWREGKLLPVSFVFRHRRNANRSPAVHVDVVVAGDRVPNVEQIVDLRGYRCALPDRGRNPGSAALLFARLAAKGENPSFFGSILDCDSQLAALRMVAGKQAEVAVLEAPVLTCHADGLPGAESLRVIASLGPLPPYRLMLNEKLPASLGERIAEALLRAERLDSHRQRLGVFGVEGFAAYTEDSYNLAEAKSVVTSVPYY